MSKYVDEKINGHHFKGNLLDPHSGIMCVNCGTDVPEGKCKSKEEKNG